MQTIRSKLGQIEKRNHFSKRTTWIVVQFLTILTLNLSSFIYVASVQAGGSWFSKVRHVSIDGTFIQIWATRDSSLSIFDVVI